VLFAAGGMVALSTDSLFIRLADADSFDIVFWVGLLMAVVLVGGTGLRDPSRLREQVRGDGRALALLALLQGSSVVLFVLAVQHTTVANVVVIVAAAPLVAAVLSWLVLRERTRARVWLAMAATAVGVAVVITGSAGGGSLDGDLFAIGAIVTFSLGAVVLRRRPDLSRPLVVGLGGAFMAVVALPWASVTGHPAKTWFALVAMGAVVGPLARVLIATAPRYLPATEVVLFAPVETVLATLWAFLAFGETPSARTWIGGAIIVLSVAWGVWPTRTVPATRTLEGG
jgi:drug/metabolite transporter (DMT)-like permease